jgi:hypothetical protein
MGLDIYFSRVNKLDYSLNKETAINDKIAIGYFRKVNCLLPHFGYEDNCEILEIEKSQIEDLVYKAKELLAVYDTISYQLHLQNIEVNYYKEIYKDNQEMCDERCKPFLKKIDEIWKPFEVVAEQQLPTTSGCFFGSQEYRDWYVADLKEIVATFEKVLEEIDFDAEQVLMYCWW